MSYYKWRFSFSRYFETISKIQLSWLVLKGTPGEIWRGRPGLHALGQSVEITLPWFHLYTT